MAGLRVGTYDGPKVSPTLGPTVLRDTSQPDIGGHIAHGLGAVAELMQQEQNKLENAQLIEFQRKANDKLTELTLSAKQKPAEALVKPGADGESGLSPFESDWQDFMQGQMEGASNDRVKEAIRLHGLQMGGHLSNQLMGIQADAAQRYKQESYAASLSSSMRNLVADPTPANFDRNRAALEFTTRQMNQGKPAEFIDEQVALVRSAARAEQLTALVETPGMWQFAKELLNDKTIDAEIVGDKDRAALKRARERWGVVAGTSAADDLFNSGIGELAAMKRSREILGDDPHVLQAFKLRYETLLQAKLRDDEVTKKKWDNAIMSWGSQYFLDRGMWPTYKQSQQQAMALGASSLEADAAAKHLDDRRKAEENFQRSRAEHVTPYELNVYQSKVNDALSDPETLVNADILVDYPDLKNAPLGLTSQLYNYQRMLKANAGNVKLTKDQLFALTKAMKDREIISSMQPTDATEKALLAEARGAFAITLSGMMAPGQLQPKPEELVKAREVILKTVPTAWYRRNKLNFQLPIEKVDDNGRRLYLQNDRTTYGPKPPTRNTNVIPDNSDLDAKE